MKAITLARVSSKEQEENNSIPSQLRRLNDYVERHSFEDVETHKLVESSTKATRKQFSEIIDRIKLSNETVALIVDTIDRLQRDFRESVLLDELRKKGKVELHFLRENLIINDKSNSADILRWDMGVMFAKSYVTQLSDNVKRGNEQKRINGEWCGKAPFGYVNTDFSEGGGRKWIAPDKATEHVVYDMYNRYASGAYSMNTLRRYIMSEYRIQLATSQIDRILKNTFYYGVMTVKGIEYRHKYEPLISKELFDKVQEVKNGFNKKKFKYAGLPYPYRGLIKCGACGCSITPEKSKGHTYYHCTQYHGKHNALYIREEDLTKQLMQAFANIQPTQEQYEQVMGLLKASHGDKMKYREQNLTSLQAELNKADKRTEKLYESYLDGDIDKDYYKKKNQELKSQKENVQNKIDSLDKASDDFYVTVENIMRISRDAPKLFESSKLEQKRELINLVLQNLELHNGQLRWEYKKPFDSMASCNKTSNWLGLVDSNFK
ncbi:MAG: recombinase family protein [Candidatus Saccharibacteria bacterium]|nr:recombinase family protein [Candidatus Saccharibacteria bacterium]